MPDCKSQARASQRHRLKHILNFISFSKGGVQRVLEIHSDWFSLSICSVLQNAHFGDIFSRLWRLQVRRPSREWPKASFIARDIWAFSQRDFFFQEFLKITVDFGDLIGLYFAMTKIAGKCEIKYLIAGVGWASAELIMTKWARKSLLKQPKSACFDYFSALGFQVLPALDWSPWRRVRLEVYPNELGFKHLSSKTTKWRAILI